MTVDMFDWEKVSRYYLQSDLLAEFTNKCQKNGKEAKDVIEEMLKAYISFDLHS